MPNIKQGYLQSNNTLIHEVSEDEDRSSIASKDRVSQMMENVADVSCRPSVFSVRGGTLHQTNDNSTTAFVTNSPFQIDSTAMGDLHSYGGISTEIRQYEMDEEAFEDSFSQDVGEMSISSRKQIFSQDDEQFGYGSQTRETEIVKTKANLIQKFENENVNAGVQLGRRDSKRYIEMEDDEDEDMERAV